MTKLKEFLKTHKYAVIWTICYIVLTWLVLFFVFGFNIFSLRHWSLLMHARIRGFAGLAFGIMMMAAIPMYIATTYMIVKNKKPLFALFPEKEKDMDANMNSPDKEEAAPEEKPLPAGIPTELKGAFMRARQNVGNRAVSNFEMKDMSASTPQAAVAEPAAAGLPLPDNFDFGDAEPDKSSAPVFKEINFDNKSEVANRQPSEEKSALHQYMERKNMDVLTDGDIIISKGLAIATHDDSDFWIADDDPSPDGAAACNWFAPGKQKSSPVLDAVRAAKKHGVSPAIYLAEKNIMDLDNKTAEWESSGVRVIKDLSEI